MSESPLAPGVADSDSVGESTLPGGGYRSQLLLLQVLVAIVLSYHVAFSHEAHLLHSVRDLVVLGLLVGTAVLFKLPLHAWEKGWFVGTLVLLDTGVTGAILHFSDNVSYGLGVTFFLIVLVAASAPTFTQVCALSFLLCAVYGLILYFGPHQAHPLSEGEWLEVPVLLIMGTFYGTAVDTVRRVRRRVEEVKKETEAKFQSVVQTARDAIILIGGDGTVLSWNRAAEQIFGYREEEILGLPLTLLMPERYREAHLRGLARYRATGQSYVVGGTVEFRGLRKDGTEFPFELSVSSWTTDSGTYFTGILRDTSERKRVEEWLRRKEEEVRQTQKMEAVGRLATQVAHDFNQVLSIINGCVALLLRRAAPDDPSVKKLKEIGKASERGQALSQQLLSFGRKQALTMTSVDLNVVVTELLPMLERLVGQGVRIVTNLQPSLDRLQADPVQLDQVLINLVTNARDAMPRGGVLTIETANVAQGQLPPGGRTDALRRGAAVMLAVSDTGAGMDKEVLARWKEPFYTTKAPGEGTGLGLTIVHGIVEQHRGVIDVQSEVGAGTAFRIFFPKAEPRPIEEPQRVAPQPRASGRRTILLVDDDRDVRQVMQEILEEEGYLVLEVGSGESALLVERQHAGPIDLLVTDVAMPGMNGKELAGRLLGLRPGLKVLYVSGLGELALGGYGVAAPTDLLVKPVIPDRLVEKVREVLERPAA
ncbi:MAG: PAS domain S-box protein [Nitrospirota bacterium]